MSRLLRFALLSGALTFTLWLVGSQPAQAWESCASLNGSPCMPLQRYHCIGDDDLLYECTCMGGDRWAGLDGELSCPV